MRLHLSSALIAAILCLKLSAALAADPWQVAGVPVDATAKDAVAARAQALDQGQREGLRRLMRRLTLPQDAARLPRVDGVAVEPYVASFQIAGEKLAPTRYVAAMTISYLPDQVRSLLRQSGVPFLRRLPDPVLVVPAYAGPDGLDLWREDDPWRAAWNGDAAQGELMDLRLPLGDLNDSATLTAEAVATNDAEALRQLAERYGASAGVIALVTPQPGASPEALDLELRRSDRPGPPFFTERLTATAEEDQAAFLARVAARAAQAVEAEWKHTLIVPDERVSTVTLGVPLADLRGWVQIRQGLASLPEVRSVRVERLTRQSAALTVAYVGDLDRLAGAVQRLGLAMVQENDEWHLRPAGDLGALPAPLSGSPALP